MPRFDSKLKQLFLALDEKQRKSVARKCGTTPLYLHKLAGGHCLPSLEKAIALKSALPGLTDADLIEAHQRRKKINETKRPG